MELLMRVYTVNSEDNKESDPPTNGNTSNSKPPKDNNNRKTDQKKTEDITEAKKLLDEYADVFKGLGYLEGHYHIKIDSSVLPVVHPPRKVPFAIKDRLKSGTGPNGEHWSDNKRHRADGMGQFHCCNRK
ncbi:hypothetical protein QZH41_001363 [Actinostola sp. cb2023]|nr:hypothetical protein QZH41_001363 [Actinostola sp. cb2023]